MTDPTTNLSAASVDSFLVWDALTGKYVNLKTSIIKKRAARFGHSGLDCGCYRQ